ncbi:MAG: hypothetical protein ACKVU0_17505 [Saprospiraceae bacterium]
MNELLLKRISDKTGIPNLVDVLSERLSASDLNSLLLSVFSRKSSQISPGELLQNYQRNRFVKPAGVDAVGFSEFSLHWLKAAQAFGFEPLQLSPLSPLGTCSVVATAHQDKIVSALRSTEVVADATNVLALESATRRKADGFPTKPLHFSTLHRHVRAQEIPNLPGFSTHFSILGLTSAGRDTGSFNFEKDCLKQQIQFYKTYFEENIGATSVKIRLKNLKGPGENRMFQSVHSFLQQTDPGWTLETQDSTQTEQVYYQGLQFKIVIPNPLGLDVEIADGGFTNWTQQLTGHKKERLLISGIGLEWLYKMLTGLV